MKRSLFILLIAILLTACNVIVQPTAPLAKPVEKIDLHSYSFESASIRNLSEGECPKPSWWVKSLIVDIVLRQTNQILVGDSQDDGSVLVAFVPEDFLSPEEKAMFEDAHLKVGQELAITLKNDSLAFVDVANCGEGNLQSKVSK
jgi:hypothetical protein